MNKQFVVAVTSIAMIMSSCVSTPKNGGFRQVASNSEVEEIARQGILGPQGSDLDFLNGQRTRKLGQSDITKLASATNIKLRAGQVLTGNDAAFDKKLELINGASKSVRMVYFIHAGDDSSSKINKALIDKAASGVSITLLVDFVTNYKNLDLFSMLEREGKGNLKTYFYNVPNEQLIEDANYTVLPCPQSAAPTSDQCFKAKQAELNKLANKKVPTPFARMLLAGMYGKNVTAMKVALGYGAEIDPKKYKSMKEHSEGIETEDMIEFAKLVSEAVIQNSLASKIKLSIAMMTLGETLNPMINEITGRLPLRNLSANKEQTESNDRGKLWDHITDYTHHKLLAVDGNQFQLGGRNVEDSYHMNRRPAESKSGKYIFVDTDFWGVTDAGGTKGIEDSFDRIIHTSMVASLDKVKEITAYDFIANTGSHTQPGAAEAATQGCVSKKDPNLGACILQALQTVKGIQGVIDYKSEKARVDAKVLAMDTAVKNYNENYLGAKLKKEGSAFGPMSADDLANAEVSYLENINYVANAKTGKIDRLTGSKIGSEDKNRKNIQSVWYRGLENVCKVSRDENREVRVIFHTAYLLMPSGMIHRLAKMMNGDFGDCSKVRVTFITNSPGTTDLGPINVLARYQLGVLFTHYASLWQYKTEFEKDSNIKYKQFFPKMEYYELKAGGANNSLHTKTTLIGDDLVIGSANADVRSYYMDTNNAVLIRNAKDLNAKYSRFVDDLVRSGTIVNEMNDFIGKSMAELRAGNSVLLHAFAKRWKQEERLTPERELAVLDNLDIAGAKVNEVTRRLITYRGDFDISGLARESGGDRFKFNKELNDAANAYDNMFKVF